MVIREAIDRDVMSLKELVAQLGYTSLNAEEILVKMKLYQKENYKLLVAEVDSNVVGFIALHWFDIFHSAGKIGRITAFCVEEQFRSQGIGQLLLVEAEKVFRNEGCTKMEVTSNKKRLRTHEFYAMQGYDEESKRFSKYLK
ncbi:MAG TPA: GNAT family N-acetyltransferase [Cyclobacteriaceae bacterium]